MAKRLPLSLPLRGAVILALAMALLLGLHLHTRAQPRERAPHPPAMQALDEDFEILKHPEFRVIPLQQAAGLARERFRGRLIGARLRPPSPDEQSRGVELVHELRLLTKSRDVLVIRIDAQSGAFLEVRGMGLAEARRRNEDDE